VQIVARTAATADEMKLVEHERTADGEAIRYITSSRRRRPPPSATGGEGWVDGRPLRRTNGRPLSPSMPLHPSTTAGGTAASHSGGPTCFERESSTEASPPTLPGVPLTCGRHNPLLSPTSAASLARPARPTAGHSQPHRQPQPPPPYASQTVPLSQATPLRPLPCVGSRQPTRSMPPSPLRSMPPSPLRPMAHARTPPAPPPFARRADVEVGLAGECRCNDPLTRHAHVVGGRSAPQQTLAARRSSPHARGAATTTPLPLTVDRTALRARAVQLAAKREAREALRRATVVV